MITIREDGLLTSDLENLTSVSTWLILSIYLFNTAFHLYLLLCGEDQAAVTVPTEILGAGLISNQPAERVMVLFPSLRHGEEK